MSSWLIAAVGCVYLVISADAAWTGKVGLSLTFLGYAIGNVGLYWMATN